MYGIDDASQLDERNIPKVRSATAAQTYKRLVGYVFNYKGRLILAIILSFLVAGSMVAILLGAANVLQLVFEQQDKVDELVAKNLEQLAEYEAGNPILMRVIPFEPETVYRDAVEWLREPGQQMRAVWVVAILVVLFAVVGGLARFFQEYMSASIAAYVSVDLGREMFDNIVRLPLRFYEERSSGEVIARLTNDIFMAGRGLMQVFMKLMREPLIMFAWLCVALYIEWRLTAIALIVLPPVAIIMAKIGKSVQRRARRSLQKVATLQTAIKEVVTAITIIKAFSMEDTVQKLVNSEYRKLRRHGLKMLQADAAMGPLTQFVMMTGLTGFMFLSARQVMNGSLLPSELVMLYGALAMMLDPIRKLSTVNNAIQMSVASAQRIFEFMDETNDITEKPGATELEPLKDEIRLEDVHFSYDGEVDVLKGVDLEIKRGEMVAVVGLSGAGKTTLAKLVPRFYDVTKGTIRFDGVDIRDATLDSLRKQIGMVTQETLLFHMTVRDNIAAGNADYPAERIEQAAQAAHADVFIKDLPYTYDTPLGEGGMGLSGGQRQRLAIARALVKDPAVLILDEATSNLDSESEQHIQQAIEEFVVGRTSIVIAHRLSTIRRADRVVVLNEGEVAEVGTHDELLERPDSIYRRLYEVQFGGGNGSPTSDA
jgi:subfamily B ATP-binding cassette protein MsbA